MFPDVDVSNLIFVVDVLTCTKDGQPTYYYIHVNVCIMTKNFILQGNRDSPAILTFHDVGLNCKYKYSGQVKHPVLDKHSCITFQGVNVVASTH